MEMKSKAKMAIALLVPAVCVLAASLVLARVEQSKRPFLIVDSTTLDTSMTNPGPGVEPVPCNDNTLGVEARCSSHSTWTTITSNRQQFTCPVTDNLNYRPKLETDTSSDVNWACDTVPKWAVGANQIVELKGELSICRDTQTITASSTCEWIPDPTLQG